MITIKEIKIKGKDKTVERAAKARKERERVASMLERGYGPQDLSKSEMPRKYIPKTKEEKLEAKINGFRKSRLLICE